MNLKSTLLLILSVTIIAFSGCGTSQMKEHKWSANTLHQLNYALTAAIVHDGFSPPVASRIYAYTAIAAYEAMVINNDSLPSLIDQLNEYEPSSMLKSDKPIDNEIVMVKAFRVISDKMLYRGYLVDSTADMLLEQLKAEVPADVYDASMTTADKLIGLIMERAGKDNYGVTRNMAKFEPTGKPNTWLPTGPTYGEALEPHWMMIHPLVMDSANQFRVPDPIEFGTDSSSAFYKHAVEVYDSCMVAMHDSTKELICKYWDCNPQKTNIKGHLVFKTRQLTPGGHWVRIAQEACQTDSLDLIQTAKVHAYVGVALMDAFISCWCEKYRTDLIRPETYIQKYYNKDWSPILETPLFPEHPSGHSVVSAASATVLTDLFGDNFAFADSAEVPFGMPIRWYDSFRQASNEAAISRLYGGIHYMAACKQGIVLGNTVGDKVLEKVKL